MSWWNLDEGDIYSKDAVVKRCTDYILSNRFNGNVAEKKQKIGLIDNKPADNLMFVPIGKGFGKSPLNANCWQPQDKRSKRTPAQKAESLAETGAQSIPASTDEGPDNVMPRVQGMKNTRPWGSSYRSAVLRLWGKCRGCPSDC